MLDRWRTRPLYQFTCKNNILRLEITSQLYYSLSGTSFFENSFSKASGLLLIFVHVSKGHAHFSNNEMLHISCEPDRPTSVFFSCEMAVNMARKAGFGVCGELLCPVFNPEKKFAFEQKLTYVCVSVIQAFLSVYFSYMGCFHQLMVSSHGHVKTIKYACMQTHTFWKTISRNQVSLPALHLPKSHTLKP